MVKHIITLQVIITIYHSYFISFLRCDAVDRGAYVRERLTVNRFDLTTQGGPNQHGTHKPRQTTRTNISPPRLELQDRPTIIQSAKLNVRPPKINMYNTFLRDYSTTPGGEMGSCTFEVRQYSAYRFRLPPTPGMRLVHFKHDQQGRPTTVRFLTDADRATLFSARSQLLFFLSFQDQ